MLHIVFDVLGVIGLLMLGHGLYLIAPVCMYIVIGILFVIFALMAERGTIKIVLPPKKQR